MERLGKIVKGNDTTGAATRCAMNHRAALLLATALAAAFAAFPAPVDAAGNDTRVVRLGYMASRTSRGEFLSGGFIAELAIRAAIEFLESKNDKVRFELIYTETPGDQSARCGDAAQELVAAEVNAVVGPPTSGCSSNANPVLRPHGIPQISQSATSARLSNKTTYPTFFRVPPSDAYQGRILASIVGACANWEKVGIIYTTAAWALDLRDVILEELALRGVEVDLQLEVPRGLALEDLTEEFRVFKEATQTTVNFMFSLQIDSINFINAAVAVGMTGSDWTWLAADGTTTNTGVTRALREAVPGLVGVVPVGSVTTPVSMEFHQFQDTVKYSRWAQDTPVPSYVPRVFDCLSAIFHAVEDAEDWSPTDIAANTRRVLEGLRRYNSSANAFDGASSSSIFFNKDQDGPALYDIVNIVDGEYVAVGDFSNDVLSYSSDILWATGESGFSACPAYMPPVSTTSPPRTVSSLDSDTVVAIAVVCALFFIFLIVVGVYLYKTRKGKMKPLDFTAVFERVSLDGSDLSVPVELPRKKLKLGDKLGEGHYGIVYKGTYADGKESMQTIAAKTLFDDYTATDVFTFKQEAVLMTQFNHPNVVRLVGVVTVGRPLLLVMEFCPNGSLDKYLQRSFQRIQVSTLGKIQMSLDVIEGMCHIASKGAIHRDLACRNILVADDFTCKVADFGLARNDTYYQSKAKNFPIKWTAPEAFNENKFSEKSDVWSFGILVCEIFLNGGTPYPGYTHDQVKVGVFVDKLRHDQVVGMPDALYALLLRCWDEDTKNRPKFSELKTLFEDLLELLQTMHDATLSHSSFTGFHSSQQPPANQKESTRRMTDITEASEMRASQEVSVLDAARAVKDAINARKDSLDRQGSKGVVIDFSSLDDADNDGVTNHAQQQQQQQQQRTQRAGSAGRQVVLLPQKPKGQVRVHQSII